MSSRTHARIILIVVLLAVAVVGVPVWMKHGKSVWDWVTYTDWMPSTQRIMFYTRNSDGSVKQKLVYLKVRTQRFFWLPGSDEIQIQISKEEWESLEGIKTQRL